MKVELKKIEKIFYFFVFFLVILGVVISHKDLSYFNNVYVVEDGLIEWLTVIALLLGAFMCFYRVYILGPFRPVFFRVCLVALGLLFIFGAGEEISWGQRIFNIESPEFFHANNAQKETNIHNLMVGDTKINKLVFGTILGIIVGVYYLLLHFLYSKFKKIRAIVDGCAIPVPKYFHTVTVLILVGIIEMTNGGKKGELMEFAMCWMFILVTYEPFNRDLFSRKVIKR